MNESTTFEKEYRELEELQQKLQSLDFQTALHPAGDETPLPVLAAAVEADDAGDILVLSAAFTPFMEDIMEDTRFLQFSVELNLKVTENNSGDLSEMIQSINGVVPIGHLCVIDDAICFRYTCAMSGSDRITDDHILEVVSFFSMIASEHNRILAKLAAGVKSLEETKAEFFSGLE